MSDGRHLAFPFRIGSDGRSVAPADLDAHVRGELVQLLLTNAGERPFLPTFGGNARRMVFEGNDAARLFASRDEVATGVAKAQLQQAIDHWLGHRLKVLALDVSSQDATLTIDVTYRLVETGQERRVRFERGGG